MVALLFPGAKFSLSCTEKKPHKQDEKNKPQLNGKKKRIYSYFWGGRRGTELHNSEQMDSKELW